MVYLNSEQRTVISIPEQKGQDEQNECIASQPAATRSDANGRMLR